MLAGDSRRFFYPTCVSSVSTRFSGGMLLSNAHFSGSMFFSFSLLSGITASATAPAALTVTLAAVAAVVTTASATAMTAHPVKCSRNSNAKNNREVEDIAMAL